MAAENETRTTQIGPDTVDEAKVYTGPVYYYTQGKRHDIPNTGMIEIGQWTPAGDERIPADYLSTYYAAIFNGIGRESILWLPAGEDDHGNRKLLITAGVDENGEYLSFTAEEAAKLAESINLVYATLATAIKQPDQAENA